MSALSIPFRLRLKLTDRHWVVASRICFSSHVTNSFLCCGESHSRSLLSIVLSGEQLP